MKAKLLILGITATLAMSSMAQGTSTEFFKDGKVWNGVYGIYGESNDKPSWISIDFSVKVCGDTIIDNHNYKKLIKSSYRHNSPTELLRQDTLVAYENNSKIYTRNIKEETKFYEQCDFNLPLGNNLYYDEVLAIDYIEVKGIKRKRLTITHNHEDYSYFVEGIGWSDTAYWCYLCNSYYYLILSVYEDGECIFTQEDFRTTATNIKRVTDIKSPLTKSRIFNLSGEEVKKARKGEVYIKDNKKFVQK